MAVDLGRFPSPFNGARCIGRKIAATRAADAGATEAQLMAIFGWTDPKMAALYAHC